ncbi:MAG: MmgE/PrpD family protein [Proteobacteria bacterium]|nr:MmgE/PrpD family protein [Pseudomonadota bacterium]MDA1021911.1 MmgE/PrpD family protein [Pseudomonadota bacterium]
MTVAKELARRILSFRYDDLPEDAITWAKTAVLDTIGVTLAGANEDCVRIVEGMQPPSPGTCLIFGRATRAGPLDAALINGTASHALDFDDFAKTIGGHPSVPLVPAIIALGEMQGTSGRDAITAYVAGYEAESKFARAVNFHHYEKGWHPTATLGIFGTVSASAHVLGLGEEQTATALSLAASLASGIKANFGTMTKPLHVGNSVRGGVMAALLARDGFTANAEAFEDKQGFFNVYNGEGNFDAERIFDTWAEPLDIVDPGLGLKQFPCCGSTHPAINCMLDLVQGKGLTPGDVAAIEILTNPRRLPHTDNPNPQSGLEAKFSIHYTVARALTDGRVAFEHFEGNAFDDKKVRALMALVRTGAHPEMAADSDNQFGAEVTVTTKDGRTLSSRIDNQLGRGPAHPMSRGELWEKFNDCAGKVLLEARILPLFEMLESFEDLKKMTDLTDAIALGGQEKERKHVV